MSDTGGSVRTAFYPDTYAKVGNYPATPVMRPSDVPHRRLRSQRLASTQFTRPDEVIAWMGAVQAQDYAATKWAVGQRMRHATDDVVERAFAEGSILRTHVLRPTWHFVAPADIRWMLALTAPRVRSAIGFQCRRMAMDEAVFKRSQKALTAALRGGRQVTRDALRQAIQRAGIATDDVRLILILMRAELDGVICSGARSGKQFTYALLDERVPRTKALTRDEALAELTRRYFTSRGPATVQDFVWWSGLTAADARAGLEMTGRHLVRDVIDGSACWRSSSAQAVPRGPRAAYLLPAYDEYLIAYKDRSAAIDPAYSARKMIVIFGPTIVLNGRVVGTWKPAPGKGAVVVTLKPFATLRAPQRRAVVEAGRRYGAFLGRTVSIEG
jgi:hypothetical protein